MKITKENAIASVQSSVSSIFSKEDVLNLINSIEGGRVITTNDIERAIDKVVSWAENNEDSLLDLDSAELEMDYQNRVSVVGIPLQIENLREALENNFYDLAEVKELVVLERGE